MPLRRRRATLGRLGSQQDMYQWLLKNRIGADRDWASANQQGTLQRVATGEQQRTANGPGGFGGWLGNVAGNVASSWLSRPGVK